MMGSEQDVVNRIKDRTYTECDIKALTETELKAPIWDEAPLLHVVAYLGTAQMMNWVIEALGDTALSQVQLAVTIYDTETNRQRTQWTPLDYASRARDGDIQEGRQKVIALLKVLGKKASGIIARPCYSYKIYGDKKFQSLTPLHVVARYQDSAVVTAMLRALGAQAPAVCATPDSEGWTPLHYAARYQDSAAVMTMLVALGTQAPDVCVKLDSEGWTPLHYAARYQDSAAVMAMLSALDTQVPAVCVKPLANSWTLLHIVARYQDSAAVKGMLATLGSQAPALCAKLNNEGLTALHYAARHQDSIAVMAILVALGSQASVVCAKSLDDGCTMLHLVARYQDSAMVKRMLAILGSQAPALCAMPNNKGSTVLHYAARCQDSTAVMEILAVLGSQAPAVCARPNAEGWTPLHYIACNQSRTLDNSALKAMLEALGPLAKRVLSLKTNEGFTPQKLSAWSVPSSGIATLLANPDPYLPTTSILPEVNFDSVCDCVAKTPPLDVSSYAQMAAKTGNVKTLLWLQTEHDLKVSTVRDKQDNTLLHIAAVGGYGAAVKWLLGAGISPQATNKASKTAQAVATGEALTVINEALKSKCNETLSSVTSVSEFLPKLTSAKAESLPHQRDSIREEENIVSPAMPL